MMTASSTSMDTNDLVPPESLTPIFASFLRLADEIQEERPRVAYLCRFYALEMAHQMDPTSNKSPGMKEFKINLLRRLERDNLTSLAHRLEQTDALEIGSFYTQYNDNHVRVLTLEDYLDKPDCRDQIQKAQHTAGLLFQVLMLVHWRELVQVSPEIIAAVRDIENKNETCDDDPSNIFPPSEEASIQPEEEDISRKHGGETQIGWSGKMLNLLKDLVLLRQFRAWVGEWLFGHLRE